MLPDANYDEALVPDYTLPDPLIRPDGTAITTAAEWEQERPRLLEIFTQQIYGQAPPVPDDLPATLLSEQTDALSGRAIRRQFRVAIPTPRGVREMTIAFYLPKDRPAPIDTFLAMNFKGNHSIETDEHLLQSSEYDRGSWASRWPLAQIIERGYGVATFYHADVSTNLREDGYQDSIFPHFYAPGQTEPAANEWGAVSAWAWGLRCAMCVLDEQLAEVNRILLLGHSRLGKAALWAGAQDERPVMVFSDNSGCLGAALSRREFGESVSIINDIWSRWMCKNFHAYTGRTADLPIDQHTLISLIAPRPVCIGSAEEDLWADPRGEYLGGYHANPVYTLYGLEGLPGPEMPPLNQQVGEHISYHIRSGPHDITLQDWTFYMDFADRHLR